MITFKLFKFISRYKLQPIYSVDGEHKLHYVIDIYRDEKYFFPRIRRRDYFCIYPAGIDDLCEEELLVFENADEWENLQAASEDEVLDKVKRKIAEQLTPL